MTAVVTNASYRMVLAFMRDLADKGIRVVACYYGEEPYTLRSNSVDTAVKVPDPYIYPNDYVNVLFSICKDIFEKEGEKPALLPINTKELEILSQPIVRSRLEEVCGLAITDHDTLDFANNKARVQELCDKLGIVTPNTYHPTCREDFEAYSYPLIVKPVCGEKYGLKAGERFLIGWDAKEAADAWEYFTRLCGETIIQDRISGEECGLACVIHNGEIITGVTEVAVRTQFLDGGQPTYIYTNPLDIYMDASAKLAKELNLTGLFMFQFMRDREGMLYMMEINCRMCGSYSICRRSKSSAGYDLFAISKGLEPLRQHGEVGVHHFILPADFFRAYQAVKSGKYLDALGCVGTWLNPKNYECVFELSDPKASFAYIFHYLRQGFGSKGAGSRRRTRLPSD